MALGRDQFVRLIVDPAIDGPDKYRLEETMPPLVNYERLRMPTEYLELLQRKLEWHVLESKRYEQT